MSGIGIGMRPHRLRSVEVEELLERSEQGHNIAIQLAVAAELVG